MNIQIKGDLGIPEGQRVGQEDNYEHIDKDIRNLCFGNKPHISKLLTELLFR